MQAVRDLKKVLATSLLKLKQLINKAKESKKKSLYATGKIK